MAEDWREGAERLMARMNHARREEPTGTWRQRWVPRVCKHADVRCVHGQEIVDRGSRVACRVCGGSLRRRPLPEVCWFTGHPHSTGTRGG